MLKNLRCPTQSWRENNFIHTITKDISVIWKVNSYVKGLNSRHCFHFQRRKPLHRATSVCVCVRVVAVVFFFMIDLYFHS